MEDNFILPDLNLPDKQSPTKLSYMKVAGDNPDQAAQIQTLSKRVDAPPPMVAANIDKVKQATTYSPEFWKNIDDKYPGTAKWAAVPANMVIAHDDLENLTAIEDTHSTFKNKFKSMGGAVGGMVQGIGGAISTASGLLGLGTEPGGWSEDEGLKSISDLGNVAGRNIADYGKKMVEYYGIKDPTFTDKLVSAATSSATFFIPGLGIAKGTMALSAMPRLAALTGAGLSATFESAIEAGAVHESMLAKGKTDNEALAAASKTFSANMVLNTGLNYAGGLFSKILPKGKSVLSQGSAVKQAVKGIGKAASAEGIQEGSQQVISNVYGEEQDKMSGVWESAILGAVVGGGMSGTIDIYNKVGEHQRAELTKEYIEKSAETYAASKLTTRAKDTANELVDAQAVPVHITPKAFDTYFQSQNIDPIQAATELGALKEYTEAKKLGVGKIEIKQSAFIGKDMDAHRPALMNDITVDPEAKSINELAEEQKEIAQTVKEMAGESDKAIKDNPALQSVHDTISKDFSDIARPAMQGVKGRGAKSSVDLVSKVVADRYITEAGKRGVDALTLYNEDKPKFFGPDSPVTMARVETPKEENIRLQKEHGELVAISKLEPKARKIALDEWNKRNPVIGPKFQSPAASFGKELYQSAWHGSPHDFEKFSLHAIGTGEGAQAYGYGLYFAGDKVVAEYYKNKLSEVTERNLYIGDTHLDNYDFTDEYVLSVQKSAQMDGSFTDDDIVASGERIIRDAERELESVDKTDDPEEYDKLQNRIKEAQKLTTVRMEEKKGQLYEVEIPDSDKMLDWDKPLSEQNDFIKSILEKENIDTSNRKVKFTQGITPNDGIYKADNGGQIETKYDFNHKTGKYEISGYEITVGGGGTFKTLEKAKEKFSSYLSGANLFYERLISKLGSAENASKYLESIGIQGLKYLDATSRGKGTGNHNYVVFDENAIEIIKKHYQGGKDPLASYTKTEQGAVINMFKGANASSLLHELSHHWLEGIHDFVKTGKADEAYLADWKLTQEYLGHKTGEALSTAQHEKFAQSFEKYIMEGKAPSVELMTTFEKLKSWMMKVYDGVKNKLGIEITPEIRGVFDRMLASKEAIEQARAEIGTESGKVEGLQGDGLKARQMAESMLLKPLMEEMGQANQVELSGKRVLAEQNAKTATEQDPLYTAIDGIRKANGHETEAPVRADAQKFIDNSLSEERANNFEVMAELNGFSSGDELAKKILASDTKEAAIAKMIEAEMKPYERLNDPAALKEDALKALHTGDNMGRLLALEGQVLEGMRLNKDVNAELSAQRRANASREWESVKIMVAETLGNKNIKEAGKFRTYYTLERKAAERVGKAMAKKDYEAASKAKREQLVSHALAAESIRILDNTDKVLRQVHKIALKDKALFKEEKNFNQVADLLSKYGFYKRNDYNPALKEETIRGWAERVGNTLSLLNEDGTVIDGSSLVTIPEWILADSKVLPYGKLTVNEFLDVTDTIKHIVHLGNIQDNAFKVGDGRAIKIIIEELIAQGQRSMPADRPREVEPGRFAKADRWANDYMGGIKRMDTMVYELDGMKDTGPFRDIFIKSQYKQANYESNKRLEMKKGMEELWKAYDKKEKKALFDKQVFYPEIGKSMTRQRLIAMALNIGAKENRQKLFENIPYGMEGATSWNEQTVMTMLQKYLTKKDWQFVQGTWDLIGKLWPDTVSLSEEMTGFKPVKVEAIAFEVMADGERINLPGGYFPLRADPRASALAAQREVSTDPLYTDLNPAWKQGVRHGHTEKRTNAQYSVSLDLTTIDRHIGEVTHDLAFRALCHDFNRILSNKDMSDFLRNKMGDTGLNFFRNYAASIAAGGNAEKLAQDATSSIVRDLNSRISTAVILGRVSVLTQNLANPFLAVNAVEGFTAYDVAKGMLSKGVGNYWVKATTNWKAQKAMQEQVFALSPFMRDRTIRPDYSLSDMKDNPLNNFLGGIIAGSDNLTNIPLWLEAYEKKMNEHGNSDKAVEYADLLINRISGSGRKYDQAKMTRGSDIERLVTKFYSFWNIEYQNWIRNVKTELKDPLHNTPAFLGFVASRAMFSYLSAILVGKGPFGDDDNENKKFWIAPLRDPIQFFPGARDIINVGVDQALGLKSYGYRPAPVSGAIENLVRLGPKIKKGEPAAMAESAMKAMSIGIPGITPSYPDQFNVWFWNAYDFAINDMDFQISDVTKRRPIKER